MGKTRRLASTLGLTMALCVNAGLAFADTKTEATTDKAPVGVSSSDDSPGESRASRADESPEERLARRKERLEQGVKRLRERADELKKKAAAGEAPPVSPTAKRPPRSYAEQAQRLEEQATKMEERAKNLTATDSPSRGGERASGSRQRRHQVRRIQLNRRWGDTLKDPEAIAELKVHAERAAKLKRIRSLAMKKSKDDPSVERATQLLAKEVARHEQHMKELQAKSVAASVANASSASPTVSPSPGSPSPAAATTPAAATEEASK